MALTAKQQEIVEARGKVIVNACPGSGKTYSVAARIANLLVENKFEYQGIASISFTNNAWKEIDEKLSTDFNIRTPLPSPHFVGTIDRFINQYIFLPFGHLIMECGKRPELVGEPHSYWSWPVGYGINRLYQYFDYYSFDCNGNMVELKDFNNIYPDTDKVFLRSEYCRVKNNLFKKGFANQADANYIAYKILKAYPLIAQSIVQRFPFIMIDEAQDTSEIQMTIIDLLIANGAEEIMLIGDPDQAIYEWNNANPELFIEKFESDEWKPICFNENRRSSQLICNAVNKFINADKSIPIDENESREFNYSPLVIGFDKDLDANVHDVKEQFLNICREHNIELESGSPKVAITYRSSSFGNYFEFPRITDIPWEPGFYHTRDIVHGKFLFEQGEFYRGYNLIEKGYLKGVLEKNHITTSDYESVILENGFVNFRKEISDFIKKLSDTSSFDSLKKWVDNFNTLGLFELKVKPKVANRHKISDLFNKSKEVESELPYKVGTVHSLKGSTFEAVLIYLTGRAGKTSNYENLFKKSEHALSPKEKEELRIVYVAMTRPRKILVLAVPPGKKVHWESKLGLI